jgi:hypothetical protein
MVELLKSAWGWFLSAITILGLVFTFLFFGSSASTKVSIVWVYALVCLLLCLLCWVLGALLMAIKERKRTVSAIRGVFSNSGNTSVDLLLLLDPNDSFSSLLKCSVYYVYDGIELFVGSAFVYNVQEDRRVQLKVTSREPSKEEIWKKIEAQDKAVVDKLLVKVGERMP